MSDFSLAKEKVLSAARWATFRAKQRVKAKLSVARGRFLRPPLPTGGNEVLVHLGCGEVDGMGFVNVDARPLAHVHYVSDVTDLAFLPDGYADLVYACHVLEHIHPGRHRAVLWEWRRILKPGGVLRLSVPDFDRLIGIYEQSGRDVDSILGPLIGPSVGYPSHQALFNESYLSRILMEAGFSATRPWDPARVEHHDFDDWASKTVRRAGEDFSVSLNLEAINGARIG